MVAGQKTRACHTDLGLLRGHRLVGLDRHRTRRLLSRVAEGSDPPTVPVIHTGGQQRPLGTSRFWEPSASEGEDTEDEGIEVVAHTEAIGLTSLPGCRQSILCPVPGFGVRLEVIGTRQALLRLAPQV